MTCNLISACAKPIPNWCTHPGSTFELKDCDGDGVVDPVCSDTHGNFGSISSKNKCVISWPNGKCHE